MTNVVTIGSNTFVCHFYLKSECRQAFQLAFEQLWRNSLEFLNANCNFVFYGFGRDDNELVAIESYKDEDLVKQLRSSEIFRTTVHQLQGYCDKPMILEIYRGLECDRSVFALYPAGPSEYHPQNGSIGALFA